MCDYSEEVNHCKSEVKALVGALHHVLFKGRIQIPVKLEDSYWDLLEALQGLCLTQFIPMCIKEHCNFSWRLTTLNLLEQKLLLLLCGKH